MKARVFVFSNILFAALLLAALSGPSFRAAAQKRPPAQKSRPAQASSTDQTATSYFRIVLNGFTVNAESDDDIFELDGRGDEIFITSNAWHVLQAEGGAVPLPQIRTKVMGEARGHRRRVSAGSGGLR